MYRKISSFNFQFHKRFFSLVLARENNILVMKKKKERGSKFHNSWEEQVFVVFWGGRGFFFLGSFGNRWC